MDRRTVIDTTNLKTFIAVAAYLVFNHLTVSQGSEVPPEITLLEVLGQPMAPTDAASAECLRDSARYITALGNYTPWALQMYDSSAKIPSGLITGNIKQLGNYDECLRVKSSAGFIGQACTASVTFELHDDGVGANETDMKDLILNIALASGIKNWTHGTTAAYEWTWCVPSTCTHTEVLEKVDVSLDALRVEGRVDMDVIMTANSCHTAKTDIRKFDTADWLYITLLIVFLLITIASTTIDLMMLKKCQEKRKDTKQIVLTSFSLYSNGKALLNTNRRGDSIGCLDGLRYISICWIIYGHGHYQQIVGVQLDLSHVTDMHKDWSTFLVLNGNIVTDTFFLLSGLLLAYTKYSQTQRSPGKTLNLFELYARRYFRLTPAYAMVIGFYATVYYKLGTGPEWDSWVGANRDYCRENWWTNLLYVNNMVNVGNMCMSQTWYLAVDMQLVWISPIFLYPMLKFTRAMIFWVILGIGLGISVAIPFTISYVMGLTGTMIYYRDPTAVAQVFLEIYTKSYARAGPYMIGLGMGYMLCKTRSKSMKIPKIYAISGWIVATIFFGTSIFGLRSMYFDDYVYDRLEASFYASFHRTVFALGVSWIIFACVHGIAGPINGLLTWTFWIPLSKLSYSAYLCHYIVLNYNSGIVRAPGNMTPYTLVHTFLGNLVLVMCISLVVALMFEMPFMVLDNALRRNRTRQSDSKANLPPLNQLDNENETYKTIDDSVSTVSQIYTDIIDIGKPDYGGPSSSGYYIDQVDSRSVKNENIYTYIIGSRIGTPQSERRYDVPTNCRVNDACKEAFSSSEEILGSMESNRSDQSAGHDNRVYQV